MAGVKIKPCPFCGGRAEIWDDEIVNQNEGYDGFRYFTVKCIACHAVGEKTFIKWFNVFSDHTVDDFRKSNLLRVKEEVRYNDYMDEQKQSAIINWNKRVEI